MSSKRLGVLSRILQGEAPVVIASAQAASSRTVRPEALRQATFKVSTDPAVNEAGICRRWSRGSRWPGTRDALRWTG